MAGRGIGNISSSSRRVSVSSISLRGGGGAARASQASGGGSSGAGFTNGKLAQVVASVSDKVGCVRSRRPCNGWTVKHYC